jgi:two-component system, OmpR family, sensor histidine kinase MprB
MSSTTATHPSRHADKKTRSQLLRERYSPLRLFNWRTFRSRITILVVLAVGLSVALGALISYLTISNTITHSLDNDLKQRAQIIASSQYKDPTYLSTATASNTLILVGVRATIVLANGEGVFPPPVPVGTTSATVQPYAPFGAPEIAVANGGSASSLRTIDAGGVVYRVYTVPDPAIAGAAVAVAVSMAETQSTLSTLTTVSLIVGLIGIALAGAAGFAIGKAALRPVEELSRATEYIARTGDLRSLTVIGDDELAQLTRNFNTMLEALARSQEHQKRLVADAGHELRTPLTSMRTNLDLLAQVMAAPDDNRLPPEERVELMQDVRAQMEELSVLISDLVELSRDEQPSHAIEHLDLRDVVDHAAERVQRRAPTLTYDLKLSPWYLDGDPAALERLITNLMDNAAKWSPEGGTVTVTLADGLLQVADQGPGIAEEDLTHVFERFYRSPEARATPGSGLGLAIVRQIAENHGGRVAAARAQGGGALLGVWLPGASVIGELPASVR